MRRFLLLMAFYLFVAVGIGYVVQAAERRPIGYLRRIGCLAAAAVYFILAGYTVAYLSWWPVFAGMVAAEILVYAGLPPEPPRRGGDCAEDLESGAEATAIEDAEQTASERRAAPAAAGR